MRSRDIKFNREIKTPPSYAALTLVICGFLALATGCTKAADSEVTVEESLVTVVAAPVTQEVVRDTHTLFSSIRGVDELAITSSISGEVAAVHVENGAPVTAGLPLFTLKSSALDKQIAQAKKSVELARENYTSAAQRYDDAQVTLKRNADLLAQGGIAQSTYDQVAQQATPAAKDAARIQYEQAQLQLKQLQQGLTDLVFTAKSSGTLNQWTLKVGDLVQPGSNLGKIINTTAYKVELTLAERLLTRLDLTTPVTIVIPSTGATYTGKIVEIGTTPQAGGKLFPVKINFSNTDASGALKSGLFCEVNFELGNPNPQIAVPSTAVLTDSDGAYVYTVPATSPATPATSATESTGSTNSSGSTDTTVTPTRVKVTLGFDNGVLVTIKSGLTEKDLIVVKGQQYITADRNVQVIKGD